ncbi:4Fe-4S dicluster protein [Hydrogenivirga caldilitoris]|uniref:4Fe-4S dicluster protein n=1 Tax=Hydrogenivirga caldilitoris TaxID=246264 RepID=A0A497XQ95_9AQUI|nr:4Fe-4S dicluster domain-containing protein [Hydrogenivirga caldilitoris]RLJ70451.1 4Fe-4S dicluster protein [Hydrogenivirga caldilitoris]
MRKGYDIHMREKVIPKEELEKLFKSLEKRGYTIVAPVLKEGVILFEEVKGFSQVAKGIYEEQGKGYYRVGRSEGWFSYVHGPNSLKSFLHPPRTELLKLKPDLSQEILLEEKKYAFFGIRGCDLAAMGVLDNVFLKKNEHQDPHYECLRREIFTVAFNCNQPGGTCFCTSMGTGPFVKDGADLSLTELREKFLLRAHSEKGLEILNSLEGSKPTEEDYREEERLKEESISKIARKVPTDGLPEKLLSKLESPVWEEIARRCLACGSCTMVCPTCFCYEVVDEVSVDGSVSVRLRTWDVCFREGFSAIHGTPLRKSIASRYRQWLMHKFSYWVGQFGEFGCVGCGRCITWCPVGIDVTEEVERLISNG